MLYLIQLSGSPSQSVLHRNRSHDSQPIGGVRAKPFSKQFVFGIITLTNITNTNNLNNEAVLAIVLAGTELMLCRCCSLLCCCRLLFFAVDEIIFMCICFSSFYFNCKDKKKHTQNKIWVFVVCSNCVNFIAFLFVLIA